MNPPAKSTASSPRGSGSSHSPGRQHRMCCWPPRAAIEQSKTTCTGGSTSRSAKTQRATGRIITPQHRRLAPPRARPRSQGHVQGLALDQAPSVQAGTTPFFTAFSTSYLKYEPTAMALPMNWTHYSAVTIRLDIYANASMLGITPCKALLRKYVQISVSI